MGQSIWQLLRMLRPVDAVGLLHIGCNLSMTASARSLRKMIWDFRRSTDVLSSEDINNFVKERGLRRSQILEIGLVGGVHPRIESRARPDGRDSIRVRVAFAGEKRVPDTCVATVDNRRQLICVVTVEAGADEVRKKALETERAEIFPVVTMDIAVATLFAAMPLRSLVGVGTDDLRPKAMELETKGAEIFGASVLSA